MKRRANRWFLAGLFLAFAYGITSAEDVKQLYSSGFGEKDSAVRRTHDPQKSDAFARELIDAADACREDAAYQALLYNKAYEFGMLFPAAGASLSIEAMEKLSQASPNTKTACDEKWLEALKKQLETDNAAARPAAESVYVDKAMEIAAGMSDAGKYKEAINVCDRALEVSGDLQPQVRAHRELILDQKSTARNIADLQVDLNKNPGSKEAAIRLVRLLVFRQDRPALAIQYLPATGDEKLKSMVPLAAKDVTDLSEQELMDLAEWYYSKTANADKFDSAIELNRVKLCDQQILAVHSRADSERINAVAGINAAKDAFEKLSPAARLAPDAALGYRLIDLMPLIDLNQDVIRAAGHWTKDRAGLSYDGKWNQGGSTAATRSGYEPAAEYDFKLNFITKNKGGDLHLLLSQDGKPFDVLFGEGEKPFCQVLCWNDPDAFVSHEAIAPNIPHYVLVQVRRGNVIAYLDGKLVAKCRTGMNWQSPPSAFVGMRAVGLYLQDLAVTFTTIEILERNGTGRRARETTLGVPSTTEVLPPVADKEPLRRVNLMKLIHLNAGAVGTWSFAGDGLTLQRWDEHDPKSRLFVPYQPPEEYDLGVEFTLIEFAGSVDLMLPQGKGRFCFSMGANGNTACGFAVVKGHPLESSPVGIRGAGMLVNGKRYKAIVYVRKDFIAASIDGKLIAEYKTDGTDLSVPEYWTTTPGMIGLGSTWGTVIFHKIEIAEISGAGKILADTRADAVPVPIAPQPAKTFSQTAVAFAIAPDLLVTSSSIKSATKIRIDRPNRVSLQARVILTDVASGLSLLKVDGAKLPCLRLAAVVKSGPVSCLCFPQLNVFGDQAKSVPVTPARISVPWTVRFTRSPRRPGAPLMQAGEVVGVELGDQRSDLATVPAVTLESLRNFAARSANPATVAPDPAQAVFQVTAEISGEGSAGPGQSADGDPSSLTMGDWLPLFNGKDKAGWQSDKDDDWKVQNGILRWNGQVASYLWTNRDNYKDFDLSFEARVSSGEYAQLIFRDPYGQPGESRHGAYAVVLNSDNNNPCKTGTLLILQSGPVCKVESAPARPDDWFAVEVSVRGNRIIVKVNGKVTADYTDLDQRFGRGHISILGGTPRGATDRYLELRKFQIREPAGAGLIEGETLTTSVNAVHEPQDQDTSPFGTQWSGNHQLFWRPTDTGETLELQLPHQIAGKYRLIVRYTKAPDYGIFQASFNGTAIGVPIDAYATQVIACPPVDLGTVVISDGAPVLKFTATGKNPASKAIFFGLDYLKLVPLQPDEKEHARASGAASRVVYLCGGSGSMFNVFGALKPLLKESINNLDEKAGQEFNVIFYRNGTYDALFNDGPHPATADAKRAAVVFIDGENALGATQPIPAIKFCLEEKPTLLFVLSNGFVTAPNVNGVISAFKNGNVSGKTDVCTVFFGERDTPEMQTMKQIAKDGHGTLRFIDSGGQ